MNPNAASDTKTLEKELSASLTSLKPSLVKRSWIDFSRNDSEIGAGGYGSVHRATLRKGTFGTKRDVAVKKLYTVGDWGKRLHVASALVQELLVWASLRHPNVLPFLGFHLSTKLDDAWLISPFAPNGNICDYLEKTRPALDERLELAKDTAKGLEYLHTRSPSVCHGDIKAVNVLVSSDKHAMLCDFGLSKPAVDTPSSTMTGTLGAGGTVRYWSPELFIPNTRPTLESDVWAWGCLLLEIITSRAPYNDVPLEGRVIHQITQNIPPANLQPGECPEHILRLLVQCWQHEPGERPNMTQALALLTAGTLHFLQEIDGKRLLSSTPSTPFSDPLERELAGILMPLERYLVKPSWFTFPKVGSTIGVGGYGSVHRAAMRRSLRGPETTVAVKKLRPAGGRDKCLRMVIALIREVTVWSHLCHPNVLPFIGYYLGPQLEVAWLVSVYARYGNLSDYLLRARFSVDARLRFALDTAKGLEYLHGLRPPICHGDIKSLNVLISRGGNAVLCDFGLAKAMENLPSGLTTSTFNQAGSLPYQSPELILGTSLRAPTSDVWAWGCVLQEIFSGNFPYHWANNPGVIVKWIIQDIPPATVNELDCPTRVKRLLSSCWQRLPDSRPTMVQCVAVLSGADEDAQEILGVLVDTSPLESIRIKRSDIAFGRSTNMGSGRFGIVYPGNILSARDGVGDVVAVKELITVEDTTARDRLSQLIEQNSQVWAWLIHPNINKFHGFCVDNETILLVSSLQSAGSLHTLLQMGRIDYSHALELITDTAQGLLYLHSRDPIICHGSIHPGNILVDSQDHAVLSDYGLVRTMEKADITHMDVNESFWRYESPEVLKGITSHTPHSDIWSLGCLVFRMVTNATLYPNITHLDELRTTIEQNAQPYAVETIDCPPRIQNVLGRCWEGTPELRASASEIAGILTGKSFRFAEVRTIQIDEFDALRFSQDGRYLALLSRKIVSIYDTKTWNMFSKLTLQPGSSRVQALHFSVSGRYLVTTDANEFNVWLWDLNLGKLVSKFSGHCKTIRGIDFSSDDAFIASAANEGDATLRLWYLNGNTKKNRVISVGGKHGNEHFCSVAISPDSAYVAGGLRLGGFGVWSTRTGSHIVTLPDPSPGWVRSVRFSPDGHWLVGGNAEGKYTCWEVSRFQQHIDTPSFAVFSANVPVMALSISPDNSRFIFLGLYGEVRPVMKGEPPQPAVPIIGKVPSQHYWSTGMDLGPMSNAGSGLVAGFAPDSNLVVIAKYASWDSPSAYCF